MIQSRRLAGLDRDLGVLATNDKDLFQLVNDKVKVYTTAKADLASPKDTYALLGEAEVVAKWDVPPTLIGDVLARNLGAAAQDVRLHREVGDERRITAHQRCHRFFDSGFCPPAHFRNQTAKFADLEVESLDCVFSQLRDP